ncbi:related to short chain dehydrogenase [Melanopsichium pennsylvanicum]|uniref:Related to short chain dehydrogenase n=2 Tax=Melanopsichium pennsylvanicum TaxID=63383 RepID=A0AAJ5C3Z5_9BASI|nr:related to short chain dehydrogenase [Melanopsichium pennsylvanicum 4]SNX83145.1 related to short chain dehydrogenase [Melanopsichium pennsylvanicum]
MAPNVAIIQGTSSGIGAQIAKQYLSRTGLQVVALSRDASRAKDAILSGDKSLDSSRLHTISLDIGSEESYHSAAKDISSRFGDSCLKTLWNINGMLVQEKNLSQVNLEHLQQTFAVNTFSHLLGFKHFVPLIPRGAEAKKIQEGAVENLAEGVLPGDLSVVASLSAKVGSISDNQKGGWYSYRASKAALNQLIKTLSKELELRSVPAISVGLHPGTVRSNLSKDFTGGEGSEKPLDRSKGQFEAHEAAKNLVDVVSGLRKGDNGTFRDYKNDVIPW